jgi:hypothetical protein
MARNVLRHSLGLQMPLLCTLIVSKAQLLEGLWRRRWHIDELSPQPLGNGKPHLSALDVSSIDDDADKEHLDIPKSIWHRSNLPTGFRQRGYKAMNPPLSTSTQLKLQPCSSSSSTERRKFVDETVNMLPWKRMHWASTSKSLPQVHVCSPKKNLANFWLCIDFRGLNDASTRISWPIPIT